MLSVQIDAQTERRLDELSSQTGRSKDAFALEAILAHLDDWEDGQLAERRLRAHRGGEAISLAVLRTEFAVDD
ncbi:TraY domain-containing protein [Sphingomonas yunnanensis]|uniref:type II toxin-antitoxin system RelB family antitoxin n=1 Tax=Sphingomonas yunnanensis TaxID=310400 RepID=UPI001CA73969|nr:TraY domain-containing protein [Sphingomonas yunnanensis]MBY9065052.1 TraY domain-containing protein [Sphingomonas yunnanensis]